MPSLDLELRKPMSMWLGANLLTCYPLHSSTAVQFTLPDIRPLSEDRHDIRGETVEMMAEISLVFYTLGWQDDKVAIPMFTQGSNLAFRFFNTSASSLSISIRTHKVLQLGQTRDIMIETVTSFAITFE